MKIMTKINQDYIYTEEWNDLKEIVLPPNSLYLYAHDPEDRSTYCAKSLKPSNRDTDFCEIVYNEDDDTIIVNGNQDKIISLHSVKHISTLLSPFENSIVYLEVTGLSCRVATPFMKYAMDNKIEMRIVYAEPLMYKIDEFCKMGINKDLCETVKGICPLPCLSNLLPHRESPLFVVLLGFEGGRFSHIIQDQSPDKEKIIPVLGVPGYKINYPYISMWGNRIQIKSTDCWQNIKYAEANSIVDIYMMLNQLSYDNRNPEIIIAPIGTKPHAIGAILYSIKHPQKVEIVYDNPIRSVNRSSGIGKLLVCNITQLFNSI